MPGEAARDKNLIKGHVGPRVPHSASIPPAELSVYVNASKRVTMDFGKFGSKDPKKDLDEIIFALMPELDLIVNRENAGLRTDKGVVIKEPGQKTIQIYREPKNRMTCISIKDCVSIILTLDESESWRAMVKTNTTTLKIHDVNTSVMITMILKVI